MKKEYESPHIEVIEIEVEDVLCMSGEQYGVSTTSFYGDEQAW